MATFVTTIIMTSHEHLLHMMILCVVAHVAWSSVVKSMCSALANHSALTFKVVTKL